MVLLGGNGEVARPFCARNSRARIERAASRSGPLPAMSSLEHGVEKEVEEAPLLASEGDGPAPPPPDLPAWYTPKRLLLLFCCIQLLVYMDRGIISSTGVKGLKATPATATTPATAGSGMAGRFNMSELQDGFVFRRVRVQCLAATPAPLVAPQHLVPLALTSPSCCCLARGRPVLTRRSPHSAFMVGLLFGSPVMAEASKYVNPFRVIAVGLTCWTLATTGCACSFSYSFILFCRCLVGLGEASFCSLAAPYIDDAAPPGKKTRWLATFFLFIPVGVAAGFMLGKLVGDAAGWRAPFLVVSWAMIPFICIMSLSKPLRLRGAAAVRPVEARGDSGDGKERWRALLRSFWADVRSLAAVPMFNITCVAWACHTALVGCLSYYGPKAAKAIFSLDGADIVFGGLTVVTGVAGSLAGAAVLDRAKGAVPYALYFSAASSGVGALLTLVTFQIHGLPGFVVLFFFAELAIFSINAVVSAAILWSVPLRLRSLAMSITTIAIHVMGDVPAPPLMGALQDRLDRSNGGDVNNWRKTFALIACYLLAASVLFFFAARIAKKSAPAISAEPDSTPDSDATLEATIQSSHSEYD